MDALTIQEARDRMNVWGQAGIPFLFVLDFDLKKPVVLELEALKREGIRCAFPGFSQQSDKQSGISISQGLVHNGYPFEAYRHQFERVQEHIRTGNSFLVNLTCSTPVLSDLSLSALYDSVEARYKLLFRDEFLVFSPETFVRIENGRIFAYPMKGTIDATLPDAARMLLENPKEAAEHATIVDLIRNDLSMVASNVQVTRYRYIDEIRTDTGSLLQMSSEISGRLTDDYPAHLGDILCAMLPAGSVTGAPKKKTVEIIQSVETYERGYYTGIFGIFDGVSLDSAVLIRFLEKTSNGLVYKSGGGITAFSDVETEYREMLQKIYVPLR